MAFSSGSSAPFVGVVVAILMGDQPWTLLTFAPVSSGITGLLGAVIGTAILGRGKKGS